MAGTIYGDAFAVTPSDSVNLPPACTGLYVGATGNVVVETLSGATITFLAVPVGALIPIQVRKVKATGTTATSIVGLQTG